MYIFIDTNIYKRISSSEKPNVGDLKTVKKLLKKKAIKGVRPYTLISTDQVTDEYYREESVDVASARNNVKNRLSNISSDLEKKPVDKLSRREKTAVARMTEIRESFKRFAEHDLERFEKESAEAVKIISDVFSLATEIKCDDQIIHLAQIRTARGKFPKTTRGSIGDAINWEVLLAQPDDGDYVLITTDSSDFVDPTTNKLFKTLQDEWDKSHPKAKITVFPFLGEFLQSVGEKKSTKKKEAEDSPPTPTPPSKGYTGYTVVTGPSSTLTVVNAAMNQPLTFNNEYWDTVLNDNNAGSFTLAGNAITANNSVFAANIEGVKLCPFCGSTNLNKSYLGYMTVSATLLGDNQYTCQNCKKSFKA